MSANQQFSDGGPLKRDVFAYTGNCQNNSMDTNELGMGSDGTLAAGELWDKTMGPWFMYFNHTATSGTQQAAQALYSDGVAQYQAEAGAWPYSWFSQENYAPASARGTVKGQIKISNPGNNNPTVAGTYIVLTQQPTTSTGAYDFQRWLKNYQYWTTTDSGGNFTISNVIAGGSNYYLWAYGPGNAGTFLSQHLNGGNPPILYTLPSTPFTVAVTAGGTNDLGSFTWTEDRVGPTVFEIGYPDRKAGEFRHGEDFFEPEFSPQLGYPTPIWGSEMRYSHEFPGDVNYAVGSSQWNTDWNYVFPSLPDVSGSYHTSQANMSFTLETSPTTGALASLYVGLVQVHYAIDVFVNGTDLGKTSGVTATPTAFSSGVVSPPYSDDSSYHITNHGPFCDERITFPASLLSTGSNLITLKATSAGNSDATMFDYVRLEMTGYVPPPPTGVQAAPGNGHNLLVWNAVPGATRYVISRSTTSGTGYSVITPGYLAQPAGGSGQYVYYTDSSATNGTLYYYVVQSYSPYGTSGYSLPVNAAASNSWLGTAPAAPTGLAVTGSGDDSVSLSWNADTGANFWSVYRTTLEDDNLGNSIPLRTILLNNAIAAGTRTFTDRTPSNGESYSYYVVATDAEGTSPASNVVSAMPLPPVPSGAPGSLGAVATSGSTVNLTWTPVSWRGGLCRLQLHHLRNLHVARELCHDAGRRSLHS